MIFAQNIHVFGQLALTWLPKEKTKNHKAISRGATSKREKGLKLQLQLQLFYLSTFET